MIKSTLFIKPLGILAVVLGSLAICASTARAGTNGDLVLTFQNPGGTTGATSTMLIDIGSPATLRDASGFQNLGSFDLGGTFGATWYDATTLFVGAVSTWRESQTNNGLLNQDPSLTLYISKPRTGLGSVGSSNSAGVSMTAGGMVTAGSNIRQTLGAVSRYVGNGTTLVQSTSSSYVDDNNPTTGILTAYGAFPGGIQQQFTSGSLFNFGSINNVEAALDIYRVQYRNDVVGQYGLGGQQYEGQYIGTVTITQNGGNSALADIGFTPVPEPSTYAMLGIAVGIVIWTIRRRKINA